MNDSGPIGIFDSGFGGLTIFRKIRQFLPAFDYIYLGDNARTPYGNRSFDTVLRFTTEAVDYLFRQNCPLIIIACNTASAKALKSIQQNWLEKNYPGRRVLGVIRPTVEVINKFTKTGKVALWATSGTVRSDSFRIEIEKHAPGIQLVQQACPLLVPLVEAGETEGDGLECFIRKYWNATQARENGIDTLLLACTHYPLLLPAIRKVVTPGISVVSQDNFVAPSLADYLKRHPEIKNRITTSGKTRFLTTDQEEYFDGLANVFMGEKLTSEKVVLAPET